MTTADGEEQGRPAGSAGRAGSPRVRRPVMSMRWETITFLHWPYPLAEVQRLLPAGIDVDPWDGRAWVSLVPLLMRVRPAVPGVTAFAETNVRTYVTGPGGEPGVWFFSLDATSRPAVMVGRAAFGLPYFHSDMDFTRDRTRVYYTGRRRSPGSVRASHRIEVEPGDEIAGSRVAELDHFLTARFRLWSVTRGAVLLCDQEHPPWRLRNATVHVLEEDLLEHAGLTTPTGDPLVHYSDAMDVRVARPHIARRRQPELPDR